MCTLTELDRFEYAYRAEGPYVAAVLSRLAVPTEAVSDAVQDVFVAAYRRWGDFDRSRPVRPWLTGFAHHIAFRYRRSAARRIRKGAALLAVQRQAERSPSEQADARVFLERFLQELPTGHREAFVLAELEGRTAPEVAEALGIGVEAVYGRLRSSRRRLRAALLDEGRKPDAKAAALVPPWGVVVARLETVAPVVGAGSPIAVAPIAASVGGSSLKVFATTLAIGLLGLGATAMTVGTGSEPIEARASRASESTTPSPTAEPRAVAEPTPVASARADEAEPGPVQVGDAAAPAFPEPAASASRPRDARPKTDEAERDAPVDALAAENALMLAAKQALAAGDPGRALKELERHAEQFPDGQLAAARHRNRVRALCDLGRGAQARAEAKTYADRHPGDPLAKQALAICQSIQNSPEAEK